MDMYSIDNGKFAVIKTSKEFVLILDDEILGPYPCEKAVVKRIYKLLKTTKDFTAIQKEMKSK